MYHRGLRPYCSVQGGKLGLSGSKSKLANADMDNMGQIRRTPKWLRSQSKMPLQAE
jgi:hypothetical protein